MTMPSVPEITPEELIHRSESGDEIQVLDIRAPERLAGGFVDVVPENLFFNIRGSQLVAMANASEAGIDAAKPVAVVCDRGMSSQGATALLRQQGFEAHSVVGGMARWMTTLVPRELPTPDGLDGFYQIDRVGKGALGYFVVSDGQALIVDPPRNFVPYLELAEKTQAEIVGIADTHVHADYISGAPVLARELRIPYYLHPADNSYPYDGTPGKLEIEPLADGTTIPLGRTALTVRHTPGHTLGSVCFVMGDDAALTGDFLFVQSIGRPDLAGKSGEWTAALWQSLQRARNEWLPDFHVFPAHYSSHAERRADQAVAATMRDLLAHNEPVQIQSEDTFTEWVKSRTSSFPEAYRTIKAVNVALAKVSPDEADVLEMGKNQCAVG